jgi:hypothetical protein
LDQSPKRRKTGLIHLLIVLEHPRRKRHLEQGGDEFLAHDE